MISLISLDVVLRRSHMKLILAKWLLLWMRARKLPHLDDSEIIQFLMIGNTASSDILEKMATVMDDDHVKMLNIGHDWLGAYV